MDIKVGHNSQPQEVMNLNDGYMRTPVRTTLHVEGPLVEIYHDHYINKMQLTSDQAFMLARSLMECAFKAEKTRLDVLPTVKEVDKMEEFLCGTPEIVCHQPLLSKFIRETKEM